MLNANGRAKYIKDVETLSSWPDFICQDSLFHAYAFFSWHSVERTIKLINIKLYNDIKYVGIKIYLQYAIKYLDYLHCYFTS